MVVDLMDKVKGNKIVIKVSQSSKCKRTRQGVCANGNNGPGFMVHSILSLYGDDHVLDGKSKYKCYVLMITIWRLYVLKHIVERSTHMCSGVTPERGLSLHHVILLHFYAKIKDSFYIVVVDRCLCRLSPRTPLYPHTSYSIGNTYPKILVQ
jgi:hypothetical protein